MLAASTSSDIDELSDQFNGDDRYSSGLLIEDDGDPPWSDDYKRVFAVLVRWQDLNGVSDDGLNVFCGERLPNVGVDLDGQCAFGHVVTTFNRAGSHQAEMVGIGASRMGKRGLQIRDSSKKNGLNLMVVVRLEHKLVPIVRAKTEFQQPMKPVKVIVALDLEKRPFEELRPVFFCGFDQDVGSGEEDVNLFQFR